jgi:hypothetical protein
MAISLASAAPSSFRSRLGLSCGFRRNAAPRPRSTNRSLTRLMVRSPTSSASAIRASSQPGPCSPWSAWSRMRARARTRADAFPLRIKASGDSRSSGVGVTRYFSFATAASSRVIR